ncbi:hypothetical protein [Azospirillum soli]|uniref:hypothetical protein n=1 Tax=Azospirillum soli TaxID=1304799 RepID=UPI001AE41489|nr:hypothetical protein [Azospirillum soli]MBP2311582.1 hypothetical protein [Azospirillum soli]
MAIDALTQDASAAMRPVQRERSSAPVTYEAWSDRTPDVEGNMSFWDFLDVINPLQHIPIVNHIYREVTGDTIQPSSKVMGGILFGGVIGGMASLANAVVEEANGKDLGGQVMASLGFGGGDHPAPAVAVAARAEGPAQAGSSAVPNAQMPNAQPGQHPLASAEAPRSADQPIRLTASAAPPAGAKAASGAIGSANPGSQVGAQLAAQQLMGSAPRDALTAGNVPHPSRMPARDTVLANTMQAKHTVPRHAAPLPGATAATAQNAVSGEAANGQTPNGPTPVSPDMLSETMMRNLAKYEQSRKAAQSAAPNLRVSS